MLERNTKIICTLGPAIDDEKTLIKMFECGMDVARLNFSHGSPKTAIKQIFKIRNAAAKANKHIAIMLDTKGPEIRVGEMENDGCFFNEGDTIKFVKEEVLGNKERIYINCKELFDDVRVGNNLLIDDGKISLEVIDVLENEIICRFLNDGYIKSKKGINAPGVELSMPFISEKDYQDIKFGCEQGVDAFALSFVRTADDVLEVKKLLRQFNTKAEVIAKIECKQGVDNLEEIMINSRTKGFSSQVRKRFVLGSYSLFVENQDKLFRKAQKVRRVIVDEYKKVLDQYDVVIATAAPTIAPHPEESVGEKMSDTYLVADNHMVLGNMSGYPSLTLPSGFVDGCPIGINVTAKAFDEQNLLNICKAIEEETGLENNTVGGAQ